ncbi:hypothetical protein [Bartonella sp. CL25QHWL]
MKVSSRMGGGETRRTRLPALGLGGIPTRRQQPSKAEIWVKNDNLK